MNCEIENLDLYARLGITDFDEESERVLRAALSGARDFHATVDCRKELFGATITRVGKEIEVVVSQYMDEDWELINDALWEVASDKNDQPDEFYEKIMAYLDEDVEFSTEAEYSELLKDPITYDELITVMNSLADSTSETLDANFNTVKALVEGELGGKNDKLLLRPLQQDHRA